MKYLLAICTLILSLGTAQAQKSLNPDGTISEEDKKKLEENLSSFAPDLEKVFKANQTVKLNNYFQADDGSLVYLRQIDNMVYALTDRYDRRYSSVWIGTLNGSTLNVTYYYIPKGQAKGSGKLRLKVSGHGRSQRMTIQKSGGGTFQSFNFETMTSLTQLPTKIPIDDRAWYRGNTADNLTGRYHVANTGKHYILDVDGQIISYAVGSRKSTHARPQFSSLFIGDKQGNKITGHYVDLPLGRTLCAGESGFDVIGQHNIRTDRDFFFYGFEHKRVIEDKREVIN